MPTEVIAVEPKVTLMAHMGPVYDLSLGAARTCYAQDFQWIDSLTPKGEKARQTLQDKYPETATLLKEATNPANQNYAAIFATLKKNHPDAEDQALLTALQQSYEARQKGNHAIGTSIYEAGHHTPFMHNHFVFALEDVSRNVIESFFHQHTFYNSEQVSQRYVEMKTARVYIPKSIKKDPEAEQKYKAAIGDAWDTYHELRASLIETQAKTMQAIGKIKDQTEKQIRQDAEKKAQEMARYVLPVAGYTQLYHTVSAITLMRYHMMCETTNVSEEAREIVNQMLNAVRAVDPKIDLILKDLSTQTPLEKENARVAQPTPLAEPAKLLRCTENPEELVATVLNELGAPGKTPEAKIERLMNTRTNGYWNETLNIWDNSYYLRALKHVHLTYQNKLSLTAHAQMQRHRLTPTTRPLLHQIMTRTPDYYTPDIIRQTPSLMRYENCMEDLWETCYELHGNHNIPMEDATYLLPNATQITYTQSGDLLSFIHLWRLRLCFNAQKEIFEVSLKQLQAAHEKMPNLTKYLGPPCVFVSPQNDEADQESVEKNCPEASWCGIKTWKNFHIQKGTPKRPY